MRCYIFDAGSGEFLRTEEREPACGEAKCEACGICLCQACRQESEPCWPRPDIGHYWVKQEESE